MGEGAKGEGTMGEGVTEGGAMGVRAIEEEAAESLEAVLYMQETQAIT